MTVEQPPIQAECPAVGEPVEGNLFVSVYPPFSCWSAEAASQARRVLERPLSKASQPPLGVYLHIPFCVDRCHYCYYRSFAHPSEDAIDRYLESLLREAALYGQLPAVTGRPVEFVYVGGGTPSLLSARQVERLWSGLSAAFACEAPREFTFECAPQTASPDLLEALRDAGVTRISLGVQQMNDEVLRRNGRVHLTADVQRAYDAIRRVGFPVVNLDLIAGLVGETETTFTDSLERIIELSPESVTIYQLEAPRNTRLARSLRTADAPVLASWDEKRARVARAFASLEQAGYCVRSAYAAVRDPRRHAFVYQEAQYRGADLVGLGLASFSYLGGVHYQNIASLNAYGAECDEGRLPCERAYRLSDEEQLVREFALQLKLGVLTTQYFADKFDVDVLERFAVPLERCAARGWLTFDREAIHVTRQGLLWVDRMIPAFYLPRHQDAAYW